jgi:hypothetical protein
MPLARTSIVCYELLGVSNTLNQNPGLTVMPVTGFVQTVYIIAYSYDLTKA